METIVEEVASPEDLKKFEKLYNEQMMRGPPSAKAQFEYAFCLVRSKYGTDRKKGIVLLEDLFHNTIDEGAKRDYLYYMAIGHCRLKDYEKVLKYTEGILKVEPQNHQASELREYAKKKMRNEGLMGMAIVGGGAAVALGALIGLGVALKKK